MFGKIQIILAAMCFLAGCWADFNVGDAPINRSEIAGEDRTILLTSVVPREGHCTKFTYYANKQDFWGNAIFQLFRPLDNNGTYDDFYYGRIRARSNKVNTHTVQKWKRYVNVRKGDRLAIELMWGEPNLVAYDAKECEEGDDPTLVFKIPRRSYTNYTFKEIPAGSKPCRTYSLQMHCKEGSAFGPIPVDRENTDPSPSRMYVLNSGLYWSGRIVAWELFAKTTGDIYLQVFRGSDTAPKTNRRNYKLIVSKKYVISQTGYNYVKIDEGDEIDVLKGDRIGFYYNGTNPLPYDKELCHSFGCSGACMPREGDSEMWYVDNPRKVRLGKTYRMKKMTEGLEWPDCRSFSLQATLITT